MKNGVSYPLAPEVIKLIEKKRREYIRKIGVKVSQARFTGIIAPRLLSSMENIKIELRPRIKIRKRIR